MSIAPIEQTMPGLPAAGERDKHRIRLREFQLRLVERMRAVSSGAQTHSNMLGVMIGERPCLLRLQQTGEIVAPAPFADVPLTRPWFLGLTNLRGRLLAVIDFALFAGEAPAEIGKESRIIAFAPSMSFNCGLLVSRVLGLRNVSEMEACAEDGGGTASWAVRRYRDRDSRIWTEIDLAAVTRDPRFLHVGL